MTLAGTGYIGISKESTFGTAVAPTHFLPVESAEATTDPQNYYPSQIKGTRSRSQGVAMGRKHELSISQDGEPASLGLFLLGALGEVTSAAGSPEGYYNHTFTPANTLPSFTVEKYDGVMTQQIAGSKIDTLSLAIEAGGEGVLKVEAEFFAQSISDKAQQATADYADKAPFTFYGATIEKGAAENSNIRSFELEISNALKDDHYALVKSKDVVAISEGMREVTFSAEMYFNNKQEYLDFMDGKSDSFKLSIEGAEGSSDKIVIELPKVMYDGFEVPMGGADDEILASIEGTAIYDSTAGGEIKVTLSNQTASY